MSGVRDGTRLGPYEIVTPIGAGGMGEVYRARDTRLDRTVAIKILSRVSPMMRERFEREARTISSLSHPHICALFDIGQHNGVDYLVMEFLDGEALVSRLARGPLAVEQVLRYGIEIADALHAAHRAGVVHRDLKPGNIIITRSGAKLLDFGLAKAIAEEPVVGSTLQKPLTEEGTLLGTVQYMAPEQLEGKEADARTDIFALGATLYEMATGKRAFEGKSRASLIASILDREPAPISQLQPLTPPALERVIKVCMAKDPDDRWQSAHDVGAELRWIAEGTSSAVGGRASRGIPRRFLWALAGLVAGLAIGAAGIWLTARGRQVAAPVARFSIPLSVNAPFFFSNRIALAISPDGTRLVYAAKSGNSTILFLRALGRMAATPIAGTEGAIIAAFSPDGSSIAFGTQSKLQRVSVDGGLPLQLADTTNPPDGIEWFGRTVYYVPQFKAGIWTVADSGGTPRQLIKPNAKDQAILWPQMLPDGKTILATAWYGGLWTDAKIVAYPIGGGAPTVLIDGGTSARYVASGHLLYARGASLYAVPFDAERLRVTGPAIPVLTGVMTGTLHGEMQYAVSKNGVLLYAPGGVIENNRSLVWIDRRGNEQSVVPTKRPYGTLAIAPDGKTIAMTLETATDDIWQLDVDRDSVTRLSHGNDDEGPIWTPDGRRIIWTSSRTGRYTLFWAPTDNSSDEQQLANSSEDVVPNDVTPDGRFVATTEVSPNNHLDVALVPLAADHKAQPYLATASNEYGLSFSPDGKWVAYLSDDSGRYEVYVRPFAASGPKRQISIEGATACHWAHNGREVFYVQKGKAYVVPVTTEPQLRVGKPQFLFEKSLARLDPMWDVSPDDQKLLWVKPESPPVSGELQIVMNWFEELKRRVPTR